MHRESEKKLDPFDVEALEKSLNDSAVRVSAIWVTFILFVLYLAIASAGVTQRQLFLEEPIKLPALNIDLAFVGFWFVSPLLLVIFHLYVVIQLVLLSRTAAAYNEAIDQRVKNDAYNSRIRQRLANTLFAQLFAGSPRERRGTLGVLLKVLAWTTLAIGPLSVLFLLQLSFLPYHSHAATWAHRALIAVDLAIVMLLWPAALDPRRDLDWNDIIGRRRPFAAFGKLLGSTAVLLFAVLALSFPGEPHAQWARTQAATDDNATMLFTLSEENDVAPTPECTSKSVFARFFSESFDRFSLSNEFFVDDDNVTKIIGQRRTKDRLLGLAERTRKFSKRDLSCGDFSLTDLRLADFSDAILIGANFAAAYLQGARFEGANARSASFAQARIDGALFSGAQLRGATFESSAGRLARFNRTLTRKAARLQGAKLDYADFAGARFGGSELHGASFRGADLRLAEFVDWISFDSTKLYGADF